jgi:hypothetical protein
MQARLSLWLSVLRLANFACNLASLVSSPF